MALRKAQAEVDSLKADALLVDVRTEVRAFAREMEDRLRANDYKGGWKSEFPQWLIARIRDELEELNAAVDRIRANGLESDLVENVWHEAADVGNFAMMVADAATQHRPIDGDPP